MRRSHGACAAQQKVTWEASCNTHDILPCPSIEPSFGSSRHCGNAKPCKATCIYHSLDVEAFLGLSWRLDLEERGGSRHTLIMLGSFVAALKNCITALGRSDTGNSHQVSHAGVKGSALKEGTCTGSTLPFMHATIQKALHQSNNSQKHQQDSNVLTMG